jgi:hypothetical protein
MSALFVAVPGGRLHILDAGSELAALIIDFLAPLPRWS